MNSINVSLNCSFPVILFPQSWDQSLENEDWRTPRTGEHLILLPQVISCHPMRPRCFRPSNSLELTPAGSDLKFTPKNGTGPYTLVIAPAAHPPVNITSASSGDTSMNYTVRLTHGQAFMAGVFDSAGNSFVIGPLHSGESTKLRCLAVSTGHKGSRVFSPGIGGFAGGIAGAFVVGALGAGLIMFFLGRKKQRGAKRVSWLTIMVGSDGMLMLGRANPKNSSTIHMPIPDPYPSAKDQVPPSTLNTPTNPHQ